MVVISMKSPLQGSSGAGQGMREQEAEMRSRGGDGREWERKRAAWA